MDVYKWIELCFEPHMNWQNWNTEWVLEVLSEHPHWSSWAPVPIGKPLTEEFYKSHINRAIIALQATREEIPLGILELIDRIRPPFVWGPTLRASWALARAYEIVDDINGRSNYSILEGWELYIDWYMCQLSRIKTERLAVNPQPVIKCSSADLAKESVRKEYMHWSNWVFCKDINEIEHRRLVAEFKAQRSRTSC